MLGLAIAILLAAFLLRNDGNHNVTVVGYHWTLPPMCMSRSLFGVDCPGCGLTRSLVALASADFSAAWGYHRVGWLLALAVIGQIPYRLYALWELRHRTVEHDWANWFAYLLILSLILNWILKTLGI